MAGSDRGQQNAPQGAFFLTDDMPRRNSCAWVRHAGFAIKAV
jgi:hypothetical protein